MTDPHDLPSLREALESLDRRILALLHERMGLAERVAAAKILSASPFRDPRREEEVLQRVRHLAVEEGLDAHKVERLYRLIFEMSVARQQAYLHELETAPLRVAYQGVEGAYSHLAAQRRYGGRPGGALLVGHETFAEVARAVREGEADVALLPIENTTAGSINETYDLLAEGGLAITGEVVSVIEHCLLGLPGTRLEDVRVVLSHRQALAQCASFLRAHPALEARAEFDTAGAARRVAEARDPALAAIASGSAASRYGLEVLARGIQSRGDNYTRFVEVAREAVPCPPGVRCTTSLVIALGHQAGALGQVLVEFGRHGVNLTKLESRPLPDTPWQYRFYLDLEGEADSAAVQRALVGARPLTTELRVLGSYPAADRPGPAEA